MVLLPRSALLNARILADRQQVIDLPAWPWHCKSKLRLAENNGEEGIPPITRTALFMADGQTTATLTYEVSIEVFGEDLDGLQFIEHTRTVVISSDGATIPMIRKLAPDSELIVRNPATNEEAVVRVVGLVHDAMFFQVYGIVFMNPPINLWQVDFSEIGSQKTVVMECLRCHTVEAIALNEIELAVFESTQSLVRQCQNDSSSTTWKKTERSTTERKAIERKVVAADQRIDLAATQARPAHDERRRGKRTAMKAAGCIRCFETETFFECEDVSRGGFRFKSRQVYPVGRPIEAAVPYAKNSVNIFVSARIAYHQELPDGLHRYGVAYLESSTPS